MKPFRLLAFAVSLFSAGAQADDLRPLVVDVHLEAAPSHHILWRIPPNLRLEVLPDLQLPADCLPQTSVPRAWTDGAGHWREQAWRCDTTLAGRAIDLRYPRGNPGLATLLKVSGDGHQATTQVTGPDVATLAVPAHRPSAVSALPVDYFLLGMAHVARGFDHLLFVACLIWIAATPRRILATVTGFTLAHSVTLGLAALEVMVVPVRTVEVLIAFSIVLLAVELARQERSTLTWRWPTAVSTGFGLLHGFGFATVLGETGLPPEGAVPALLAFNLGIEAGQLLFVGAVMTLVPKPAGLRLAVAYAAGLVATYWMVERAAFGMPFPGG